jgi:GH24 family phage-related lysozyme (muramidase)
MTLPAETMAVIREREGLHKLGADGLIRPYKCPAGKLTQGWGCTVGVKPDDVWTPEQADARLEFELARHEARVDRLVKVKLSPNARGALVSFDYNSGGLTLPNGKPSGVLVAVNSGNLDAVPAQLMRWTKYTDPKTGAVMDAPGLVKRRRYECALWRGLYDELPADPGPAVARTGTVRSADQPQAVAQPVPPRPLADTATAANATLQTAGGVAMAATAAVETATKFDHLGTVGLVVAGCLITVPLVMAGGGVWQIMDRAKKQVMGV